MVSTRAIIAITQIATKHWISHLVPSNFVPPVTICCTVTENATKLSNLASSETVKTQSTNRQNGSEGCAASLRESAMVLSNEENDNTAENRLAISKFISRPRTGMGKDVDSNSMIAIKPTKVIIAPRTSATTMMKAVNPGPSDTSAVVLLELERFKNKSSILILSNLVIRCSHTVGTSVG